ncbi:MAG: ankyrin repeat domain-containing protein [Alphaproteobacteria bacterium]|nr:ankyrin repeat domain-containing protein [Alphaproteobacteria bacterium]
MKINSHTTEEPFWAARNNDCEACRNLVSGGVSLETKDAAGNTPLQVAIFANSLDVAAEMIQLDANVNTKNDDDKAVLHFAKTVDAVRLLIQKGADIETRDSLGNTPLATSTNKDVTEELIRQGADINARNNKGGTPIMHAALFGYKDVMEVFLAHGAEINITTYEGASIIDLLNLYEDVSPEREQIKERLIQENTRRTTEAFEKAARQGTPKRRKIIRPGTKACTP